MTVGSLFSGIGGLDLGLERAGHRVLWQVESNAFCRRVLARHWPHVPCYTDVTTVTGHDLAPVDLLCGGFPCQPVSQAGPRKGTDDTKWLWPDFARLLRVLRPRYALLENVPGLLTANGGGAFRDILTDLAECGYSATWQDLPAASVGAPHLRYRIFLVAYPDDESQSGCSIYADAGESLSEFARCHQWDKRTPDMDRMADGIPHRMDRLRALGNAVVPQVAEWIGRRLNDAS